MTKINIGHLENNCTDYTNSQSTQLTCVVAGIST